MGIEILFCLKWTLGNRYKYNIPFIHATDSDQAICRSGCLVTLELTGAFIAPETMLPN
jgi:hypothetical protein